MSRQSSSSVSPQPPHPFALSLSKAIGSHTPFALSLSKGAARIGLRQAQPERDSIAGSKPIEGRPQAVPSSEDDILIDIREGKPNRKIAAAERQLALIFVDGMYPAASTLPFV